MWSVFITKSYFKLSTPFSQGETYNGVWFFKLWLCFIYYVIYRLLISLRVLWLTLYHWHQKWALEEWQPTSYSVGRLAFCFPPACGCYSSRRSCPGHSYWSDYLLESFYSYLQINSMYSKGVKATTAIWPTIANCGFKAATTATAITTACTCLTTVYNCVHSNQLPPGLGADFMLQADIFSVYTMEINMVKITEWWKVSIFN